MKFNHESETLTECFGISSSKVDVADEVTAIVKEWMMSEHSDKVSVLGEMLHNKLSYEVIMFLATQEVYHKVKETMSELTSILEKIDSIVKGNVDRSKLN